jgi:hypothetical protein
MGQPFALCACLRMLLQRTTSLRSSWPVDPVAKVARKSGRATARITGATTRPHRNWIIDDDRLYIPGRGRRVSCCVSLAISAQDDHLYRGIGSKLVANWRQISQSQFAETLYVIEKYGRHEETRTPDLYRVKIAFGQPAIDSKGVNNRRNRQNRNNRRNLLPNCYQKHGKWVRG